MRAGRLRHRITLRLKSVTGQDSYGQETKTWTDAATRWASVEPLSGRELFNAQQVQADVTHRITLRWIDGITPAYEVVFGSRTFEVLSVIRRDERKIMCEILTKERV